MQEYNRTAENGIKHRAREDQELAAGLLKALTEHFQKQRGPPVIFEPQVLQCKHTASAIHHAASKQLQQGSECECCRVQWLVFHFEPCSVHCLVSCVLNGLTPSWMPTMIALVCKHILTLLQRLWTLAFSCSSILVCKP